MDMTTTCTVRFASGHTCGKAAVHTFTSRDGETFAECAEHFAGERETFGTRVGDKVTVHRHGKDFTATVVEVGARGAVFAEFTFGNGVRRKVRV